MPKVHRDDLDRAVEIIASVISAIRSRDHIPLLSAELARERAANAVQAVLGEFELRRRDNGPLLLAIAGDQVARVDVFADTAGPDTEVARLTLYSPAAILALTADEARALVDGLAAVDRAGVR